MYVIKYQYRDGLSDDNEIVFGTIDGLYCDVFDEAKLNLQRLKNHYEFLKAYVNEGSESKRKTLIKNVSREPWFVSGKHAGSRFQVNLSKQWLPFICIVPWTSRYDTLISIWIEKVAFIHDETTKIDFHT